jgi:prepilin-type processing-associated H-X9-DG protein
MKTAHLRRVLAFTLVELLIVVGLIAVLIAMLLPVLSKVREQGRQTICLSNLRQLGAAMISYAADYDGYLPATAQNQWDLTGPYSGKYPPNDWLFWQHDRLLTYPNGDGIKHSGLARYLGLTPNNVAVLRCPSDDIESHPGPQPNTQAGPYPFSYVMNWLSASDSSYISTAKPPYSGPPYPVPCLSLHKVLNPSQKVLMYEEDPISMANAEGIAWAGCTTFSANTDPSTWGTFGKVNLLSLRHDPSKAPADPLTANSQAGAWSSAVPSPDARGNAVFCDGHADFVTRAFLHRPDHAVGSQ